MSITIRDLEVWDIRFPTSRTLDGSDAVNVDPDYSAAYVVLKTSGEKIFGRQCVSACYTAERAKRDCVADLHTVNTGADWGRGNLME